MPFIARPGPRCWRLSSQQLPPLRRSALSGWLAVLVGCATHVPAEKRGDTVDGSAPVAELVEDGEVESISGAAPDPGLLFDSSRVMAVEIEMAAEDWAALRRETRSMFDLLAGDCLSEPAASPYTWFPADVRLDGELIESVSLRKKGFIGSLSTTKPGMKMEFDELVEDRRIHGMERMALNNTPQDPTMLRTCLAYAHFNAVGVPAPRCGFAHVVVNGEDLGVYATVQPVDDHFLADHGHDPESPLFEGTLSDFRDGWMATYDLDSPAADRAQLEPILAAVESGDLDEIAAVIDIDAYIRFWVAEAMMAHWDGYGWNTNNYFVFLDPADGKARFVPWGADATWASAYPGGGVDWIPLTSALNRALVTHPVVEEAYRAEVARQLDVVGSTEAALAQIDAYADTIASWHRNPGALSDLRWLAEFHLDTMAGSAREAWPTPTGPMRDPFCMAERGDISYTFEGDWGSIGGAGAPGSCTGSYSWDGTAADFAPGVLYAGVQDGWAVVACQHAGAAPGALLMTYALLPPDELALADFQTDNTVIHNTLYYTDSSYEGRWDDVAWVEGSLRIEQLDPGGAVRGRFDGTLWQPPW